MPRKSKTQLDHEIQSALTNDKVGGKGIRAVAMATDPDTGKERAYVTWSDGSATVGGPGNAHIKALIGRARKEGVRVTRGGGRGGRGKTRTAPKPPPLRIAYRLRLTPDEMRAVEFARGRYAWADMLSQEMAEDGSIAFTEPQMWQWTDDVDTDDAPFPLAAPAFAEKLQSFYNERV